MKVKMMLLPLIFVLGPVLAGEWTVDSTNAKVEFSVKGPFGTVHGNFTGLKAKIAFDEKNPAAGSIEASVDAKTVSSGVGMRNHHLCNEEQWLNTDKFPTISFRSKKIEKSSNGYTAVGELTLKGVTKPVQIPFTLSPAGGTSQFKGQFTIKRADFNLGKPGGSVGEEITINLTAPVHH